MCRTADTNWAASARALGSGSPRAEPRACNTCEHRSPPHAASITTYKRGPCCNIPISNTKYILFNNFIPTYHNILVSVYFKIWPPPKSKEFSYLSKNKSFVNKRSLTITIMVSYNAAIQGCRSLDITLGSRCKFLRAYSSLIQVRSTILIATWNLENIFEVASPYKTLVI